MMRGQDHLSVKDQMEDLRERMRLLQGDRKANIDILEANKNANKEEIRRLRAENKDVRMKLSQLVKGGSHGDEVIDLEHAQREVHRLRKAYNQHKSRRARHQHAIINSVLTKLRMALRDDNGTLDIHFGRGGGAEII